MKYTCDDDISIVQGIRFSDGKVIFRVDDEWKVESVSFDDYVSRRELNKLTIVIERKCCHNELERRV